MGLWDKLRQVSSDVRKLRLSRGPGDHENWRHPSPSQVRAAQRQMFAAIEEHS